MGRHLQPWKVDRQRTAILEWMQKLKLTRRRSTFICVLLKISYFSTRLQFNPEETQGEYPSAGKKSTSQAALSVPVGGDAGVASKLVKHNFKSKSLI